MCAYIHTYYETRTNLALLKYPVLIVPLHHLVGGVLLGTHTYYISVLLPSLWHLGRLEAFALVTPFFPSLRRWPFWATRTHIPTKQAPPEKWRPVKRTVATPTPMNLRRRASGEERTEVLHLPWRPVVVIPHKSLTKAPPPPVEPPAPPPPSRGNPGFLLQSQRLYHHHTVPWRHPRTDNTC
jgi:hypothetical protein